MNIDEICSYWKKKYNILIDVIKERYGTSVAIDIMEEVDNIYENSELLEESE